MMLSATVFTVTNAFSMLQLKMGILMCVVDLFNDFVTLMEKTVNQNFKESGT
jgi:hypothetical protein